MGEETRRPRIIRVTAHKGRVIPCSASTLPLTQPSVIERLAREQEEVSSATSSDEVFIAESRRISLRRAIREQSAHRPVRLMAEEVCELEP